ncbi:hypothetical protein LWI29_034645 [Acer saccharum]|uniref:Uncharacterized protein n=1 Tax=Acer saccharum TaxID=4024 RepID=A0AA39S948_ACESA|nr:hypothetical protein LWI29_034645 [Acer saccharum]
MLAKQVISIQSAVSLGFVSQLWVDMGSVGDVVLVPTADEEEEEEDIHLAPSSADDAPTSTTPVNAADQIPVPSRPSGHVVGIIKRNWGAKILMMHYIVRLSQMEIMKLEYVSFTKSFTFQWKL